MSLNEWAILKSPVITERSAILKEKYNKYVFKVDPNVSKGTIKDSIQKLFKVHVERVHTLNVHGKWKRLSQGRPQGKRSDWKKAIVTIKKGEEIKLDELQG